MNPISRRRALALGGGVLAAGATAVATAGLADAESTRAGWLNLVVITANIGRTNLGQRERAIRDVRDTVQLGGKRANPIVGWQEIGGGDPDAAEIRWINERFGSGYRNVVGGGAASEVPMSIPREYDVVDKRVTQCHGGKAGVSPSRFVNQVLLSHSADAKLQFVFANTHYVSGAWNGQTDPYEKWRDEMWRRHFAKHRDDVLGYWRKRNIPVIWVGDVNRSPMPKLLPDHERRAFANGIDQVAWVSGGNGTEFQLSSTKVIPMHVDSHDARAAIMKVRRA